MSASIPPGYAYHVLSPEGYPDLMCRFLKPVEFTIAELPQEEVDFSKSERFLPLIVTLTQYGPMIFTVGARPSYSDGTVAQWLDYLLSEEGYHHSLVTETAVGTLPGVTCDAVQQASDGMAMRMRFVLLEDGGRLFQMSAMAPDPFWAAAIEKMTPMLESLELRESRGTSVPLIR